MFKFRPQFGSYFGGGGWEGEIWSDVTVEFIIFLFALFYFVLIIRMKLVKIMMIIVMVVNHPHRFYRLSISSSLSLPLSPYSSHNHLYHHHHYHHNELSYSSAWLRHRFLFENISVADIFRKINSASENLPREVRQVESLKKKDEVKSHLLN